MPARLADKTGNTARATTLINEAVARLPADASPLTRLRFTSAQAGIRNSARALQDAIRLDHEALKLADARPEPWRKAEVRSSLRPFFTTKSMGDGTGLGLASSLAIERDDLEEMPFHTIGGMGRAYELFGDELAKLLDELYQWLAA